MIFNESEIDVDDSLSNKPSYVTVDTLLERVQQGIHRKLSFSRDYETGQWVRLEDAEQFIVQMNELLKKLEK